MKKNATNPILIVLFILVLFTIVGAALYLGGAISTSSWVFPSWMWYPVCIIVSCWFTFFMCLLAFANYRAYETAEGDPTSSGNTGS